MTYAGGQLLEPAARDMCRFCPVTDTDALLGRPDIQTEARWRSLGITLAFSLVNVLGALGLYWLFRVPKTASSALTLPLAPKTPTLSTQARKPSLSP